jgi:hypothetical protein
MVNEGNVNSIRDTKPMCTPCFDLIPSDIRKRVIKYSDIEKRAKQSMK